MLGKTSFKATSGTSVQLHKKPWEVRVANFMTVIRLDMQNILQMLPLSVAEKTQRPLSTVSKTAMVNHVYWRYQFNQMTQKEG